MKNPKYFLIKRSAYLLAITIILFFNSCKKEIDSSVIVKGNIKLNSADDRFGLILNKVFEDHVKAVDSLIVNKRDDNFVFKVKDEGIYFMESSDKQMENIYLILQKGKPVYLEYNVKDHQRAFIKDDSGINRSVHKQLYELTKDNKALYSYLALSEKERLKSDLRPVFLKKQDQVIKELSGKQNSLLNQLSAFKYVNYTYFLGTMDYYNNSEPFQTETLIGCEKIFKTVPPESFLWSYNVQLPMMLLSNYRFPFTLEGFSNILKDHQEILDTIIIHQSDANVSGYTNIFTMYSFTLSDEKDRIHKYVDLYYNRDTLTYSKEITTMFNTFFSPRRKIRAGEALPEFVIPSLRDSTVVYTNNSFRKGVYLLDFWATWCKPCMKEIPQHHKAYKAYHNSKDFEILSISFDKAPKVVENFRRTKWPMPWKHAILVKGKNDPLAKKMSALYLPQMILVDGRTNTVIAEMIRLKEGNLEKILYDYYNK